MTGDIQSAEAPNLEVGGEGRQKYHKRSGT